MKRIDEKRRRHVRRKIRIRKSISGTAERPRLTVYRSNRRIYLQAIDDVAGKTVASASTLEKEFADLSVCVSSAEKIGEILGGRLKEKKIRSVVYDRNGYRYHGIVKAAADGTRKTGIKV